MKNIDFGDFDSLPSQVKIGGAFALAALALLALDAGLDAGPSAAVAAASAPATIESAAAAVAPGPRNLTYYPEQLAALASLSSFQPTADFEPTGSIAPQDPAVAPEPVHRPDLKPASNALAAPTAETESPAAKPLRILGLAVPGSAEVGERMASLRDGAARWSEGFSALGGKIAALWR